MTAQALVKDVKKLIDAMTTDRDALTEAAQMIAKTVSRLSEEVKVAASALTSENQTGQVLDICTTCPTCVALTILI